MHTAQSTHHTTPTSSPLDLLIDRTVPLPLLIAPLPLVLLHWTLDEPDVELFPARQTRASPPPPLHPPSPVRRQPKARLPHASLVLIPRADRKQPAVTTRTPDT